MRLKFDPDNPNAYRCCFCCHVRTGTILLGIYNLFVQLLAFTVFAVLVLHPGLVQIPKDNRVSLWLCPNDNNEVDVPILDVYPNDDSNLSYESYRQQAITPMQHQRIVSEDKFIGLLLVVGSFAVTLMLVFGAVRGRPGYMMPFFCLQVFDFCITCLTVVGYFSYIPNIKQYIASQDIITGHCRHYLLDMDTDWLMLMVILFFVFILTVKAYLIGVVWACYKFLSNNTLYGRHGVLTYRDDASAETTGTDDTEMLLPPKYEDAVRMSLEQPAPPPYTAT